MRILDRIESALLSLRSGFRRYGAQSTGFSWGFLGLRCRKQLLARVAPSTLVADLGLLVCALLLSVHAAAVSAPSRSLSSSSSVKEECLSQTIKAATHLLLLVSAASGPQNSETEIYMCILDWVESRIFSLLLFLCPMTH